MDCLRALADFLYSDKLVLEICLSVKGNTLLVLAADIIFPYS